MKQLVKITALVLLLVFTLTIASCAKSKVYEIQWSFTIPKDYQGYIVIRYNCPNGIYLQKLDGVIQLNVDDSGIVCIANDQFPYSGPLPIVKNSSGLPILFTQGPEKYKGYAMCCNESRSITQAKSNGIGRLTIIYDIFYVGLLTGKVDDVVNISNGIPVFIRKSFY